MPKVMHALIILTLFFTGQAENAVTPESQQESARTPDVVYVGTPDDMVLKMLDLAEMKKDDVIYDLGCGDGRVLVLAAQKYGCRGNGYEIDPERIAIAKANVRKNGVASLVSIIQQDIFTLDLSPADVISLYLLPGLNMKLIPQLEKLKPGSRIVTHEYGFEGYTPDKVFSGVSNEDNAHHNLYLYVTPMKQTYSAPQPQSSGLQTPPQQ
jgi:SAM-dependent methyltransferase